VATNAVVLNEPQEVAIKKTSFWSRMPLVGALNRSMNRRDFESQVSKIVNSALGHESEGLVAGSDEYKRLWNIADKLLVTYCKDWEVDRADLEAQIPAIRKMKLLANPLQSDGKPKVTVGKAIAALIGVCFGLLVLGAAAGMFNVGYQLAHHLVK
jgi:hypothetical protein